MTQADLLLFTKIMTLFIVWALSPFMAYYSWYFIKELIHFVYIQNLECKDIRYEKKDGRLKVYRGVGAK